jgi:hypothetical protein
MTCWPLASWAERIGSTIDFEDLYPGHEGEGVVPGDYTGYKLGAPAGNWMYRTKYCSSDEGLQHGTIGQVSGYNYGGESIGLYRYDVPFILHGAFMTTDTYNYTQKMPYSPGVAVEIYGWAYPPALSETGHSDGPTYHKTIYLTDQLQYFTFDEWGLVTEVDICRGPSLINWFHLIIDNINVEIETDPPVVPLPATSVLVSSGLLGLMGWRRFRKS